MAEVDLTKGVYLANDTYDRFRDAYVALVDALTEARPYVYNTMSDRNMNKDWRYETARSVLGRVDAALAMRANLDKTGDEGIT